MNASGSKKRWDFGFAVQAVSGSPGTSGFREMEKLKICHSEVYFLLCFYVRVSILPACLCVVRVKTATLLYQRGDGLQCPFPKKIRKPEAILWIMTWLITESLLKERLRVPFLCAAPHVGTQFIIIDLQTLFREMSGCACSVQCWSLN